MLRVPRNPLASRKIQRVNQRTTLFDAELQIVNGVSDKAVIGKIASYLEDAWGGDLLRLL